MSARWEAFLAALQARLDQAFARLDDALVLDATRSARRPPDGGWSVREIAEHVVLSDHHLLLLAGKLARKARERAARGEPIPSAPPSLVELEALAERSFRWSAPEHMLPRGELELPAARRTLRADRERCRLILDALPPGAGALCSARFSPLEARLDLHQFLALVALHAGRHARQAGRVRSEIEGDTPRP